MSESETNDSPTERPTGSRFVNRLGPFAIALALVSAMSSFFILSGLTPIAADARLATILFVADGVSLLLLIIIVVGEGWSLFSAWRAGVAASRLHFRIVRAFSLAAAIPALVIAIVGTITLDRSISPGFMQDVRAFIFNTAEAARLFRQSQCRSLLQEAQLTAADLDRAKPMFDADRTLFHEFFSSRAKYLGFTQAALMKEDGEKLDTAEFPPDGKAKSDFIKPEPSDFEDARKSEATCVVADEGKTFVALRKIDSFPGVYLYAARPVDPFTLEFPQQAASLISVYNGFEAQRRNIIVAFATMFGVIAFVMLLSAIWLGLAFANRLVAPIRRLIAATDEVASGNLYVRVPIDKAEGDLSHLGETFNKMTSELRLQQNRLLAASRLIDERRVFTEAVLSGVPAAVVGVDPHGLVTVVNPSAERLLLTRADEAAIGHAVSETLPEIAPILQDAAASHRSAQGQVAMTRAGRERILNVRVTSGASDESGRSFVVTLDDITDLVTAQRTSAWADVARRIAHEIKNPLTPIQLSAERLKRKYGRVITVDKDVFDQCTDTIVRQVDDIKRMVDEFSSFARMPKAKPESDDLVQCIRQVVFLMRVGHPDIDIQEHFAVERLPAMFDRRLISQALTNVIKNATEGVAASEGANGPGRIDVSLAVSDGIAAIDVIDNGRGFPTENRQRLLEPYVTTRSEGTGLGLPIVAKIMEDHGGGIELLDAPDGPGAYVRLFMRVEGGAGAHIADQANTALLKETDQQKAKN
ncbi:MAG: PAS domain-containing sensor histidine kinase [Hyphomicrobiales bacterium]|nr:PAS domain-containing sensor histidine kinase [Hyphomicrobiales bacterium]